MDKMKFESPDMTAQNIDRIAALFPNCITEMLDEEHSTPEKKVYKRTVNFELLKQMLSPDVVDGDEAYEFTWVGKKAAIVEANKPIRKTLRPCVAESKDWDNTENLYIEGDNLEVLKLLQESYLGKVKMIFIDPPYNTGTDVFVYTDSFEMSTEEYEESINYRDDDDNIQFVPNGAANPRFHSNWLSMMYSRLMLARNFLEENGAIFITIDHTEHASLKMLCDEVFGARCFIGDLIWRSSDNSNNNALTFSEDHNYILVYSKNPNWRPNFINDPKKRSHFKNPDDDPRGPWFDGNPVNNPGLRVNLQYDITTPSGKIIHHPANGWRWSWETVQEKLKTGELRFSDDETRLIRRTYLCDMEGLPPSSLCIDLDVTGHTRGAKYELKKLFPEIPVTNLFSTPKPTLLLKYLLQIGADKNCIVMDFFSGSASTADAIMQMNYEDSGHRRFIMVQVPEPCEQDKAGNPVVFRNICEMGKERIRRAGDRIQKERAENIATTKHEWDQTSYYMEHKEECDKLGHLPDEYFAKQHPPIDTGFRVLKLDDTNMKDVYYAPDDYDQDMLAALESNIKDDRTDLDLLFGCLIDWGLPLSLPYKSEQIDGCTVHTYNDGDLIACFDANIPESVVKEIAQRKPLRAVFRDSGFASSPEKINVFEIFKLYMPEDAGDISKRVRVI